MSRTSNLEFTTDYTNMGDGYDDPQALRFTSGVRGTEYTKGGVYIEPIDKLGIEVLSDQWVLTLSQAVKLRDALTEHIRAVSEPVTESRLVTVDFDDYIAAVATDAKWHNVHSLAELLRESSATYLLTDISAIKPYEINPEGFLTVEVTGVWYDTKEAVEEYA